MAFALRSASRHGPSHILCGSDRVVEFLHDPLLGQDLAIQPPGLVVADEKRKAREFVWQQSALGRHSARIPLSPAGSLRLPLLGLLLVLFLAEIAATRWSGRLLPGDKGVRNANPPQRK